MGREGISGSIKKGQSQQMAAMHYFESGVPHKTFLKTWESLYTQAEALFGDTAADVLCGAARSTNPQSYIEDRLEVFTTSPTA